MKYLVIALIIALLGMGGLIYFQAKSAERQKWERITENKLHQQRVSEIQATLLQERGKVERERAERHKTDSLFRVSLSAQKSKTAREQRKVTELRPQIDQLADSITVLAQFLDANDSLFAGKAVEIALLTGKIHTDSVSHDLETRHLNNQIENLMSVHVEDHRTIEDLQKEVVKLGKKANKRLSFGFTGGYSITQYDNKLITGPSITGGIHYRLFSF